MIISIDPGITGAIALVGGENIEVHDMPIMAKTSGKGNQVDPYTLGDIIKKLSGRNYIQGVAIERVGPMPTQGVTSVFSFGKSAGMLEGCIGCLGLPMFFPTPQKWKKYFDLIKKEKDTARLLLLEMHPELSEVLKRKKDGGRADAILIGLYLFNQLKK